VFVVSFFSIYFGASVTTDAVHGTEHGVLFMEWSTGCCSRTEHGVLFTEWSTGCCSRTEHGVLFTGARGAVQSTECCSWTEYGVMTTVLFKIREGKFCQPAKLMPKETGF
jgi:hypothetical protein